MLYSNGTASAQIKTGAGTLKGVVVNSHTSGTLRFNDGTSGTTSAGVKATQTLTITSTISDGETVTVGDKVYTFKTALSSPAVVNEVLIGVSDAVALDNLKAAINDSGTEGTDYSTGTAANPNVTATTNTDTTQVVEAHRVGTYANTIATTETMANGSFGAATLENGAEASVLIANTFTYPSGSGVYMLGDGISFADGLYATVGGTIDYTIIYD